jgi:hypothetical protein
VAARVHAAWLAAALHAALEMSLLRCRGGSPPNLRWLTRLGAAPQQRAGPLSTISTVGDQNQERGQTNRRLRRLITQELRGAVHQEKLLRRLQALWERRPAAERETFLTYLATELGSSTDGAEEGLACTAQALGSASGSGERELLLLRARRLLAPEYERLAEGLAERAEGLRLLLDLRATALQLVRRGGGGGEAGGGGGPVRAFEAHLLQRFRQWFAPGMLAM